MGKRQCSWTISANAGFSLPANALNEHEKGREGAVQAAGQVYALCVYSVRHSCEQHCGRLLPM